MRTATWEARTSSSSTFPRWRTTTRTRTSTGCRWIQIRSHTGSSTPAAGDPHPSASRPAQPRMNGPAATILIPTFDHGPLVRLALESALAQTVAEIEVFVVGDGVPDVTREIVGEIAEGDPR